MFCIGVGLTGDAAAQKAAPRSPAENECQHEDTTGAMRACENGRYDAA
jgi:hypothetical protein